MSSESDQPSRRSTSLPIAFTSFSIILVVLLSWLSGSSVTPKIPNVDQPVDEGVQVDDGPEFFNKTLLRRVDPYSCTKDIPCHTEACCGSFFDGDVGTCGFGDTYCGSDCVSQCDAKPECGQYANPPGKTCPLNVCCSEFGFCGTTPEFCDASQGCQSNCGSPAIPPGKSAKPVTNKVIGYYEAWSARRECYPFPPAAIPIEGLTHLNFAFAYIDPSTFEVIPMDDITPSSLFTQTADVRTFQSGVSTLEVFVSLGGWTFSDNGTATQPTFGKIASTEANRQRFANNMVKFMKKYGFDGVDIDWEYPGAGDRGGNPADTDNFVLLMKTLRETFDSSAHGPYGLTFTIPSSYWYLRWFDVPGMLKYADWTNVMTYDLHGVWDRENPIGEIVQGHTNLTEIKRSMDLLWRNNIAPEKVVFGMGFYGRSFQLKSRTCSSPGCGFEIQDIIADQNPHVVHDKEAAVKYFTFGTDQWVSFDDDETFKQKIDWANDVGLGGVMIWSIDQDDKKFSALTGLLGRSVKDYNTLLQRMETTDAGKWTSINGQKCIMTDCGLPPTCPSGYGLAPNGGGFHDTCGNSQFKIICCPLDAMPSSCLWRGGESSTGRPSCHGQCHTGEVTLFHSRHATKNCLRPGFQAFCCETETWTRQIQECKYTSCGKKCGDGDTSGMVKVAQKRGECLWGEAQELCCPSDAAFQNCHWVGKGTCDDNECDDNDVQLDTNTYGDSSGGCVGNSRKKVLCCNSPKNLNPFLPVALDKVFPTLPPAENYPQFDLQNLGGDSVLTGDTNANTFGLIIIVGPEEAVQSLRRRDGSDLHVLDCHNIRTDGRSHIRLVCSDEGANSTCDRIHRGGVEGTVLRMPDGCGPGSYSVLHAVRPAADKSLPHHVARSAPWNPRILDAEISYDFGLVKRDSGEIYIRIDYSNSLGYWNSIVQGDPAKKRKRTAAPLSERFYSSSASDWKSKFDQLRHVNSAAPITLGQGSLNKKSFDVMLSGESPEKCSTKGDDGYLKMGVSGTLHEELEFGYSFVGTISPSFNIEEAYGYFDTNLQLTGALNFNGKGYLSVPAGMAGANLFNSPVSAWGFSHPGICDFGPWVNIEAQMTGEGEINGDFTAKFIIGNDGVVTDSLPESTGGYSGGVSNSLLSNTFSGALTLPASSVSTHTKRKSNSGDGTILGLRFLTTSQMKLDLHFYGAKEVAAGVEFNQTLDSYLRINRQSDGSPRISFSNQQATVESFTQGDLPWGDDDTQRVLGHGDTLILHDGAETPAGRDAPTINGYALFGGHDLMDCSNSDGGGSGLQECLCISSMDQFDRSLDLDPETGNAYDFTTRRRRRRRTRMSDLRELDPSLNVDPETGKPYEEGSAIETRAYGAPVSYTVNPPSGNSWTVTMNRYPNGRDGASLIQANPNAGRYGAADCRNCEDVDISSASDDPDLRPVTEHIHERQTEPRAQEYMMTGQARRGDGTLVRSAYINRPVPERYLDPNSYLFQPYSAWDPNGPYTADGRPIDQITNAYGSDTNPDVLVNADSVLNGYKARIWVGHQPMSDELWNSNGFNIADVQHVEGAINTIRTAIQVTSYLNDDQVNENWSTVVNDVMEIYGHYQDRVLAVDGVQLHAREMYQEFVREVVVVDIENSEYWILRRLNQVRNLWQPLVGQDPNAQGVIDTLKELSDLMDTLLVDTTKMDLGD
ncbi:uncharacterized protein ATNIH1004_001636 [Aspergillus tanneri]|uniref:chitinase n=1 Tax=Aspergillus tanneri TaxID=1220188 RepID=A0A5M9N011_9EURO|nr:uncharacterized protein ATNIH1004_001636 [Aspergillus tanneri]KAA8652731.1 hypothetical protein ATNIH1004_001636 [Aspergillus tanneri]